MIFGPVSRSKHVFITKPEISIDESQSETTADLPSKSSVDGLGPKMADLKRRMSTVVLAPLQTNAALNIGNKRYGDVTVHAKSSISENKFSKHRAQEESSESLEAQMTEEHLMQLQMIFDETAENGCAGLDMEQFRVALKKTMGRDVDNRELDKMFMKVDTNCDGTVDMDEYLTYMLLEYQEKQSMVSIDAENPLPDCITPIRSNHADSVVKIAKMQGLRSQPGSNSTMPEYDEQATRYAG